MQQMNILEIQNILINIKQCRRLIMKYKEIEYSGHLDGCIDELLKYKAKGELVSINFNDHMLYSDTITVDGAYQEVLGVTKVEWKERYERERLRHEKRRMEDDMEILKRAIKHYGAENQMAQSIEELAELIVAINKYTRYPDEIESKHHVIEEIADVLIMIDQLKIILDIKDYEIRCYRDYKLQRLEKRIKGE